MNYNNDFVISGAFSLKKCEKEASEWSNQTMLQGINFCHPCINNSIMMPIS